MAQSTVALLILLGTLVLYVIPKMSLAVTTLLALAAMVVFGIVDFPTAVAGFSNKVLFLVVSLTILGQAMVNTGLTDKVGAIVRRLKLDRSKKVFVLSMLCMATVLGVFLNGAIVVAIMLPIVDTVVLASEGRILRKDSYWVVGLGSTYGNNLLTISATSMLTAVSMLVDMGYEEMNMFLPMLINLPGVLAVVAFYATVGIKLQDKWFDFPEVPIEGAGSEAKAVEKPLWKQWVVGLTFVVLVVLMLAGLDYGVLCILATAIVVTTGCISEKEAWGCVSWGTLIVVAGAIGLGNAVSVSGAGEVITNFFLTIAGPLAESGFGVCVLLFFISALLTSFMSDNATVAIMLPIAASICGNLGLDATPIFLAVCSGTKTGILTPICVTPMTQACAAGYRMKDFLRMGGLLTLISMIFTCAMLGIVFY